MSPAPPVNVTVGAVIKELPVIVPAPVLPRVTLELPVIVADTCTVVVLPTAPSKETLAALIGEVTEIVLGFITVIACGVPAFIVEVVPVSITTSEPPTVDGAKVTDPILLKYALPVVLSVMLEVVVFTGKLATPMEPEPDVSETDCPTSMPSEPRI